MSTQQSGYEMPDQTVFERQMEELKSDMREMRKDISQLVAAMAKLAVMEERHLSFGSEMSRFSSRLSSIETKVIEMELHRAKFDGSVTGATTTARIVWAIAGGTIASLAAPLLKLAVGH